MNEEMQKKMKKIGREISVLMGVTLSFFLSLVGTATSGHFSVSGWLLSFLLSTIISLIIGFFVPMKRVLDSVDQKAGLTPGTLPARCLESLISDLIYTPIITLAMVGYAYFGLTAAAASGAPIVVPPFVPMFLRSLLITMIVGYILIFLLMPVYMKLVMKRNGMTGGPKGTGANGDH